jgi:hypothetical protein
MELKFVIRRFIAGLITTPLAWAGYFVLYMTLVALGTGPVGSYLDAVDEFPVIAFAWIAGWVFSPVIWKWAVKE